MASYNRGGFVPYTEKDVKTMQEEAVRRVMEMQSMSKSMANSYQGNNKNGTGSQNQSKPSQNAGRQNHSQTHSQNSYKNGASQNQSGGSFGSLPKNQNSFQSANNQSQKSAQSVSQNRDILSAFFPDGLKLDEEKVLIGILIFLLAKNGADIKLLLALGYLLL